jgi:hypothetical protein
MQLSLQEPLSAQCWSAIPVVPLARYVVLIAATCAIVGIYFTRGIPALIADVNGTQVVVITEPAFSAGTVAGVLARHWNTSRAHHVGLYPSSAQPPGEQSAILIEGDEGSAQIVSFHGAFHRFV